MGVPAFDADGLLPLGDDYLGMDGDVALFSGHGATLTEVYESLVRGMVDSTSRPRLYAEVVNMVDFCLRYMPCVIIRISGEFVTAKLNPSDITIVLDVAASEVAEVPPLDVWLIHRLFHRRQAKIGKGLSAYSELIVRYPAGHEREAEGERRIKRALSILANARKGTHQAGHLEVLHCREGEEVPVAALS